MVCLVPKTVRRCPDESSDALSDAAGLLTGPAPAGPFLARAPMQPFYSVSSMSNVVKAHLGLILSYVIWAVNYPLYKVIMPHYISPYAMTMLVVGVAALLAFGSMLFVPIEPVRRQDILKLVAAAALMGIAKKLFLMVGIQHTRPDRRVDHRYAGADSGARHFGDVSRRPLYADEGAGHGARSRGRARGDSQRKRDAGAVGQAGGRCGRAAGYRRLLVLDGVAQGTDHAL